MVWSGLVEMYVLRMRRSGLSYGDLHVGYDGIEQPQEEDCQEIDWTGDCQEIVQRCYGGWKEEVTEDIQYRYLTFNSFTQLIMHQFI